MKTCTIVLAILAVAVSNTDAFGIGNGIHRTAALTSNTRASSSIVGKDGVVSSTSISGPSSSVSVLNMASDTGGNEPVTIDKDFRLSAIFLGGGLLLDNIPYLQLTLGPIVTLLGILFLVQTFRLNFVCDASTFALEESSSEETGENIIVGGENRWTYDSFVNYDFFPAGWIDQPQGPILIYFKETQTPQGKKFLISFDSCSLEFLCSCIER